VVHSLADCNPNSRLAFQLMETGFEPLLIELSPAERQAHVAQVRLCHIIGVEDVNPRFEGASRGRWDLQAWQRRDRFPFQGISASIREGACLT
jgi:hypothetical protein